MEDTEVEALANLMETTILFKGMMEKRSVSTSGFLANWRTRMIVLKPREIAWHASALTYLRDEQPLGKLEGLESVSEIEPVAGKQTVTLTVNAGGVTLKLKSKQSKARALNWNLANSRHVDGSLRHQRISIRRIQCCQSSPLRGW